MSIKLSGGAQKGGPPHKLRKSGHFKENVTMKSRQFRSLANLSKMDPVLPPTTTTTAWELTRRLLGSFPATGYYYYSLLLLHSPLLLQAWSLLQATTTTAHYYYNPLLLHATFIINLMQGSGDPGMRLIMNLDFKATTTTQAPRELVLVMKIR